MNSNSARVLVTGAAGFVGQVVCRQLLDKGFRVRACVRSEPQAALLTQSGAPIEFFHVKDIAEHCDWREPLDGVDSVIHLAARVHMMRDAAVDPVAEYARMNVSATKQLAKAASQRGCRFVFVSSIKVNGERTPGKPFDENDSPNPQDAYGVSKWEAEKELQRLAADGGLEFVIIRPPLVYGPGVRANFLRLLELVYNGIPLPLGRASNVRSLIGVENLADLLVQCVTHEAAANQTFIVRDAENVSTRELAINIANAFGRPCRLLPFPEPVLRLAASMTGKREEVGRLLDSLTVSCAKVRNGLGWKPPMSMQDGLSATARWFESLRTAP